MPPHCPLPRSFAPSLSSKLDRDSRERLPKIRSSTSELFRGLVNCDYTVRAQRSLQAFWWVYYFRFLLNLLRSFTITCILCCCTSYRKFDTWIMSGYFLGCEIYFRIFYVIVIIIIIIKYKMKLPWYRQIYLIVLIFDFKIEYYLFLHNDKKKGYL